MFILPENAAASPSVMYCGREVNPIDQLSVPCIYHYHCGLPKGAGLCCHLVNCKAKSVWLYSPDGSTLWLLWRLASHVIIIWRDNNYLVTFLLSFLSPKQPTCWYLLKSMIMFCHFLNLEYFAYLAWFWSWIIIYIRISSNFVDFLFWSI